MIIYIYRLYQNISPRYLPRFHDMSNFAQPRCKDLHSKSWASQAKATPHWLPHLHRSPWRMRPSLAADKVSRGDFQHREHDFSRTGKLT